MKLQQALLELILAKLEVALCRLETLERNDVNMAKTLDEVLAEVTAEDTKLDGLSTLITGLKQQLADALSGTNLPPAVQAKVDAIFTQAEQNTAKIDAALSANTPTASP